MPKTKLNIIKPVLGVFGVPDPHLVSRLNAVHDGMLNNPAYANPPVDMAAFKAAIDAYTAAVAAALDGGKGPIAARDKLRADVVLLMRLLGHYVEVACKGDISAFLSSGFVAALPAIHIAVQPVSVPYIVAVDQGSSGQLVVTIKVVARARSYELRYGLVPAAGAIVNWTTIMVPNAKPATILNNFTPGGTYTFQVRAYGKLGFSDWSALVERMCI